MCLLTPWLTTGNADDLIAAASDKTKSEIEVLLAQRLPRSEMFALVDAAPGPSSNDGRLAPAQVGTHAPGESDVQLAARPVDSAGAHLAPLAPTRFSLHVSIGQSTHDKLRRAQELLGHQVPSGDLAVVIETALDMLIAKLEGARLAATSRPQRKPRPTTSARHIPAHVKRAVRERDGDRCTFVSESGRRCASRTRLEFDHVEEVARGGESTIGNVRLRCRAHNQYAAECTFGREFMDRKREAARHDAPAAPRTSASATHATTANSSAPRASATVDHSDADLDVRPWLRQLGFRAADAQRGAVHCASMPHARLEERVRTAIAFLGRT